MRAILSTLALALAALAPASAVAAPAPAPAWTINSTAVPTNFAPGGEGIYEVRVENSGGAAADGSALTITDELPAGVSVERVELPLRAQDASDGKIKIEDFGESHCNVQSVGESQTVSCEVPATLPGTEPARLGASEYVRIVIYLDVSPAASGTLTNSVEVQGGGAPAAAASTQNEASPDPAPAGFQEFEAALVGPDGLPQTQAASHPYQYTTSFAVNTVTGSGIRPFDPAEGDVKDVEVKLPPGLVGNPTAATFCTGQQFNSFTQITPSQVVSNCPDSSVVGFIVVRQLEGKSPQVLTSAIYNLVPPKGMPAQFGFQVASLPFYIDTELRTGSDYGISAEVKNTSQLKAVTAASVTIWGVPAHPRHDRLRGPCLNHAEETKPLSLGECPAGLAVKPFLRAPTSCASPLGFRMSFNLWNDHARFLEASSVSPAPSGCNQLAFEPTLEARPTTDVADSPSGLSVDLHIPQNEDPEGLGSADVRKAVVTLPEGLVINPSGANGLQGCSAAQIDLGGPGPARCPDAAKIGSVEVQTPLLGHTLPGAVYVATPGDNPFNSLLAIYIVVDDPTSGVVVKLAGHVVPDPQTGRLTTTFDENPQLPFDHFRLNFFGGAYAPLRTPAICASFATTSQLTPFSAPESGPPATPSDTYAISRAPGGAPCATSEAALPHAPGFAAGTLAPIAGAFSPLVVRLNREDGSQELASLTVTPPPGLLGRLAGVPYCPEAALAAAAAKPGYAEQGAPSCPAASQVGTVNVGAGAGPAPYYAQGKAYLAGPYKGAPLSLAVVTPATAGPYDLGTVVVRTALHVNSETAQITASSDPIPRILAGIPLDVRSIAVRIDRPGFTLNPTSCEPMQIGGAATSVLGRSAGLAERFQVGECGRLEFAPKLSVRLFGKTRRGGHPRLRAALKMPPAGANLARAQVTLPRSEFLEQGHIRTICTRVQFAARACPAGSIYGKARAFSPLLEHPLEGPVYLRSSDNELPDLVLALRGQVDIDAVARIDSVKGGGIRTTFAAVPDAPVSKVVLSMFGGKRGLLVNSENICKKANRMKAAFTAQNAKRRVIRPKVKASCAKRKSRRGHRRSG